MAPGERERVEFKCGCGANIRAPASAAGRKARCPKCQQVLVLGKPAMVEAHSRADGRTDAASSAAGSAPPDTGRVKMRCACGAGLGVPTSAAGRKVKCPKCGQTLTVPRAATPATGPSDQPAGDLDFDSLLTGLATGEAVTVARPPPVVMASQRPSGGEDLYGLAPLERTAQETPPAVQGKPQTCPSCRKTFPAGAKICIECGINLKTGRALITTQDENLDRNYFYAENVIRVISWLFPIGIDPIPIASEAFGLRKPWVIRGIAVVTILVSAWFMVVFIYPDEPADPSLKNLMLWSGQRGDIRTQLHDRGLSDKDIDAAVQMGLLDLEQQPGEYRPSQLITHALLHGGPVHLAGNLLFLMVLGSRVNALIGNVLTLILYPLLAVASGLAHVASTAGGALHPMLGASGAIMGLAGMYLVLFPVHKVHTAIWARWMIFGELHLKMFAVRGFWVVLYYIAFDVIYTVAGWQDNVAHWAHLGGFLTGAGVALVLLFSRLVNARGGDLLTAILGRHAWGLIGKPNRPGLSLW